MLHTFPEHTGIYNIRDNIEYLELEVHFRHINSLLKLPKFDLTLNKVNINNSTKKIESFEQTNNAITLTVFLCFFYSVTSLFNNCFKV